MGDHLTGVSNVCNTGHLMLAIRANYIEYSYRRLFIDRTIMRVVIMNVYIIIIEITIRYSNIYDYYTVCMRIHLYCIRYTYMLIYTYTYTLYTHILIRIYICIDI